MMQAQQAMLGGQGASLLGGGMFNDPRFQQAFQGNDISGALGQANQAFGQQMGTGTQGLGQLAGMFGGAVPGLMQQGMMNQQMAGNQGALQSQELAGLRAQAQPEQNRMFNQLQDRLFAQGRLGSTGGAENMRGLFEAQGQQDLGFQSEAFNRAMQQQQFMGQLGGQQMGQAGQFGQQAGGLIGQGFGQTLQSLQQNQQAGLSRLQAAQGLFGQGADIFGSQFGLGLGAQDALSNINQLGLQAGRAPWELQAGLLSGSGQHANALQELGSTAIGSGKKGLLGGLFSDERLKDNLYRLGTLGDFGWYSWDWNDLAHEVGAHNQPSYGVIAQEVEKIMPEAVFESRGFKTVNYDMILGV
jgi:hypothetical protein